MSCSRPIRYCACRSALTRAIRTATTVMLGALAASGCGGSASVDFSFGDPTPGLPADPPYTGLVSFPSGLRLNLVRDEALTDTYPAVASNPLGPARDRHYAPVGYFIDLPGAPLSELVSLNFRLSEYVNPTLQRGGRRAYVDAQIADHLQRIRSGLGRPLFVNSAYRSPEHNQAVGGAAFSRHIYGDAVDVDVDHLAPDAGERAQEIYNEAMDAGVDYLMPLSETSVDVNGEWRVSWVHLDDRGF